MNKQCRKFLYDTKVDSSLYSNLERHEEKMSESRQSYVRRPTINLISAILVCKL